MKTKTKQKSLSKNAKSLAGEFSVLSQLALRGFDASMTLGQTKSVDILIADPKTQRMAKLEVKTKLGFHEYPEKNMFGHTYDWLMSQKHEKIRDKNLFYCFVRLAEDGSCSRFFIVPSGVVADYVKKQHRYYLLKKPKNKNSKMRIFRIGLGKSKYPIPTPLAVDYENKWSFR